MNTHAHTLNKALLELGRTLTGELAVDDLSKVLYATDASVYREIPLAVAFPKNSDDVKKLVAFSRMYATSLIPRAAGTSLAGQCVGRGMIVDVGKHLNQILNFYPAKRLIRVQPGVVRDDLNRFLKPHGLFFGPTTSTANRAMIGGMVGNNASGTTSIVYGTTRDKVVELDTVLSDGSEAVFKAVSKTEFERKCALPSLEGQVYRWAKETLSKPEVREGILSEFPKPSIQRRNTGYALDYLTGTSAFDASKEDFDFCKLLCGSEGTLAVTTAVTLQLDPLPEPVDIVVAAHFETIDSAMRASQLAVRHRASAVELMDKIILDCTKANLAHSPSRSFVVGDPVALLLIEFRGHSEEDASAKGAQLVADLKASALGYAYPVVGPDKTKSVWALRSAGLGLLANLPGDRKAVACIEDTAVALEDLPNYISEFAQMMSKYEQKPVHYGHAGAGEIHLRPLLDLKTKGDRQVFYEITKDAASLVKKYRGSLSGEHGDGRVRTPFLPIAVGAANYALFRELKRIWDPSGILNPGKIVDAPSMNTFLRYEEDVQTPDYRTVLDFSREGGVLRMAEKCNGSADCRKGPLSGGTMCPSYQATRQERDSTRGRANTLREFLSKRNNGNPFDHPEIKEALDLCLSCKGCVSECPSNVDMSTLKAEFLYQYQKVHGVPFRSRVFAHINDLNVLGERLYGLSNWVLSSNLTARIMKRVLGIAAKRSVPKISRTSLFSWYKTQWPRLPKLREPVKTLYLFLDEFSNYYDADIGATTVRLLHALNYEVKIITNEESGRSAISKGLLEKARRHAEANVLIFSELVGPDTPLVGIEPSAILGFRHEYPRLVRGPELKKRAEDLKDFTFTLEEFLGREIELGNIRESQFIEQEREVLIHGHCHQKALSSLRWTELCLSLPKNYKVRTIPSGCCGMAGSFGYEKEHYNLSMTIGEMVLFPAVRSAGSNVLVVAAGTSCRHQIMDGTARHAEHPAQVLFAALKK